MIDFFEGGLFSDAPIQLSISSCMSVKAPKLTKNYYSNNRQNKNLLVDRFCRLFDFVDYDYLLNNQ